MTQAAALCITVCGLTYGDFVCVVRYVHAASADVHKHVNMYDMKRQTQHSQMSVRQ